MNIPCIASRLSTPSLTSQFIAKGKFLNLSSFFAKIWRNSRCVGAGGRVNSSCLGPLVSPFVPTVCSAPSTEYLQLWYRNPVIEDTDDSLMMLMCLGVLWLTILQKSYCKSLYINWLVILNSWYTYSIASGHRFTLWIKRKLYFINPHLLFASNLLSNPFKLNPTEVKLEKVTSEGPGNFHHRPDCLHPSGKS